MLSFSGITITKVSEDVTTSSSVVEIGPLPKGYGFTLATALRRVMLSSLQGAAITSVRINNLDHEFTTIPGVKQNILDIVLHLKNLRIEMVGDEPVILTLSKKGIGPVKASDFATSKEARIVNSDYHIADLTDASAQLTIEAVVEKSVGYKRAEESLRDEIGRIPVDAIFSPVQMVDPKVLPSRKGSRTDYDKVVFSIMTDGSIDGMKAVTDGIEILRTFFGELYAITTGTPVSAKVETSALAEKITSMTLSDEVKAVLAESGIETVSDLVANTKAYYQKDLGMKAKHFKEIQGLLDQYNLDLAKDEKKSKKTKS